MSGEWRKSSGKSSIFNDHGYIVALIALAFVGSLYACTKLTKLMFVAIFNGMAGLVQMPSLIIAAFMSFGRNLKSSFGSFKSMLKEQARKVKSIRIFTIPKPDPDEKPEPVLVRHEALWSKEIDWSAFDEPAWLRHNKNMTFKV